MYNVIKISHFCNVKLARSSRVDSMDIAFYDMTMVFKGRLVYTVNGERITLDAGDAILLPPGTHRGRTPLSEPVHYVSFNFTSEAEISLPPILRGAVTKEITALFDAFTPSHLSDERRAAEKAAAIASYVLIALAEVADGKYENPHISRALKYIDEHMDEPIGLTSLAGALHLSREYAAALIKRETGMTASELINERKLSMAVRMIRDGEMSLSDVARELGYENYGYFSRLFKSRYGAPPKSFKN